MKIRFGSETFSAKRGNILITKEKDRRLHMNIDKSIVIRYALIIISFTFISIILAQTYFKQEVVTINDQTYSLKSIDEKHALLRSSSSDEIKISITESQRIVSYNNEQYIASLSSSELNPVYSVTLPDDTSYTVTDNQNFLYATDEHGEMVIGFAVYVNGNVISPDPPAYLHPATVITLAYPQYYEHRGFLPLFIISLVVILIGYTIFRFEAVQTLLFRLSLYSLFIVDPEPSDFYYMMQKFGGIIIVLIGALSLIYSLFIIV